MQYTAKYNSKIGEILLASDGESLTGLWFVGQKYLPALPQASAKEDLAIFKQTKKWLDIYFSGKAPNFTPPLSLAGVSPFRKRVWEIMLTIPYGKTTTYGLIAKQIAEETHQRVAAQAVGGAVGHNAIAIIIPCHRVIGANAHLTGYAGGLAKKMMLLKMERELVEA